MTKRVEIRVTLGRLPEHGISVVDYLTGARALGRSSEDELQECASTDGAGFEATSIVDERRKVLAAIARRQGAPMFRRAILKTYQGRCTISGCDAQAVLEAAHVIPYMGKSTNHVQNGLLLRADLHTLFDRGLLGIHPDTYTVVLHPDLLTTAYGDLHGQRIRLPSREGEWPSSEALRRHLRGAGLSIEAGLEGVESP